MNSTFVRFVCRMLVVCMASLPFQANAGLVATGEVAAAKSPPAARVALTSQLEALGIAADSARERVAALSDAEVVQLAGRIDKLPAGAGGVAVGMILVLIFLFWRFQFSDQSKAAAKTPAK